MDSQEKPVVIQVHPLLLEEFKLLKEKMEKKVGYKIYGGMPIVSKLVALQIKENRTGHKQIVEIIYEKVKGEKKIKLFI